MLATCTVAAVFQCQGAAEAAWAIALMGLFDLPHPLLWCWPDLLTSVPHVDDGVGRPALLRADEVGLGWMPA